MATPISIEHYAMMTRTLFNMHCIFTTVIYLSGNHCVFTQTASSHNNGVIHVFIAPLPMLMNKTFIFPRDI